MLGLPSRPQIMKDALQTMDILTMLISRLERLSADSYWAHQASGVRGSLLRAYELLQQANLSPERRLPETKQAELTVLIEKGFDLLAKAAHEIETPNI